MKKYLHIAFLNFILQVNSRSKSATYLMIKEAIMSFDNLEFVEVEQRISAVTEEIAQYIQDEKIELES